MGGWPVPYTPFDHPAYNGSGDHALPPPTAEAMATARAAITPRGFRVGDAYGPGWFGAVPVRLQASRDTYLAQREAGGAAVSPRPSPPPGSGYQPGVGPASGVGANASGFGNYGYANPAAYVPAPAQAQAATPEQERKRNPLLSALSGTTNY